MKNVIKQNQDDVISDATNTTETATTVVMNQTNTTSDNEPSKHTNTTGSKRRNILTQFKDKLIELFEEVQTDAQDAELK